MGSTSPSLNSDFKEVMTSNIQDKVKEISLPKKEKGSSVSKATSQIISSTGEFHCNQTKFPSRQTIFSNEESSTNLNATGLSFKPSISPEKPKESFRPLLQDIRDPSTISNNSDYSSQSELPKEEYTSPIGVQQEVNGDKATLVNSFSLNSEKPTEENQTTYSLGGAPDIKKEAPINELHGIFKTY